MVHFKVIYDSRNEMQQIGMFINLLGKSDNEYQKGGIQMEAKMSVDEVVRKIAELVQKEGQPLRKKMVKKTNPKLMKNALFYFPSWEEAIERSTKS